MASRGPGIVAANCPRVKRLVRRNAPAFVDLHVIWVKDMGGNDLDWLCGLFLKAIGIS
jgi:hypothetical protein